MSVIAPSIEFETAFSNAPLGMALLDLEGRWLRANGPLCEITGYSEDELRELTYADITHPDDLAADESKAAELLAGTIDSYQLEKRYLRKDGRVVWILLAGTIVRDAEGEPQHYIAQIIDISERKRLERDLADASRGFELASDLLCTATFDGYLVRVNGAWESVLGWSEEELRARRFIEFVHPDDRERTLAVTKTFELGGESRFFRNRWRTRSGAWRWLEWNAVGVVEEDRVFCVARDVSEKVELEQERELQEQVINNMVEGVCLVTMAADPAIVYANPSFEQSLGYEPGELGGTSAAAVFTPPDISDAEREAVERAIDELEQEGSAQYEARCLRKDGASIWCRITASGFDHPEHGPVWVVVQQDITRERLEREAWAEAERGKDRFYGAISHELRTPLTSIVGFTALLEQCESLSPEERDYVRVIERNAARQTRFVEDLLSVARAQAGDFDLERRRIDLAEVVKDATESLRPQATARGTRLEVRAPTPVALRADPDRLAQVVSNLVSNAIKYTPAGGSVEVALSADPRAARLVVRDSGEGIGADERELVFDRFYRSVEGARLADGVGLGLTIARAIVEAHGGRIAIRESGPEGTVMEVELPLPRH